MAAVSLPLFLSACSLKVKVRDDWEKVFDRPIPLKESVGVWQSLRSGRDPGTSALEAYNKAVRDSVVQIAGWDPSRDGGTVLKTDLGRLGLEVVPANLPPLSEIDEILPADSVRVQRGLRSEASVSGVGAPLIVRQKRSEGDPHIPETGLWFPVTAILNLDRPQSPVLELIDPTRRLSARPIPAPLPLSADYTAAFARDFHDRQFQFENLSALLRFEQFADRLGIYRVTSLDPAKEPCVFIHGINSSPSTWDETINRLYGDPAVRDRYEFWTFGYPTGAPIPYMASRFREGIKEMLAFRQSRGAGAQRVTIVGHSMGGLLAKSLTLSSGDEEWNRFFKVPIGELDVSEADREILRRMLYFEPIPEVKRVVFCSTPHRGAEIAEIPAAKLVGDLIEVPSHILRLSTEILTKSADALTPEGMEFTRNRLTSLDQLGSGAWNTIGFLNKPLNPSVTYHSVIGSNRGPDVPVGRTSDNIVPYSSSHLEGVASEKVVFRSKHSVHATDGGIEEIARILKLP